MARSSLVAARSALVAEILNGLASPPVHPGHNRTPRKHPRRPADPNPPRHFDVADPSRARQPTRRSASRRSASLGDPATPLEIELVQPLIPREPRSLLPSRGEPFVRGARLRATGPMRTPDSARQPAANSPALSEGRSSRRASLRRVEQHIATTSPLRPLWRKDGQRVTSRHLRERQTHLGCTPRSPDAGASLRE